MIDALPPEEIRRIEVEALTAMEAFKDYRQGEVLLQRIRTPGGHTYKVTFGEKVVREDNRGVKSAISTFLYYMQRRCTSCGQRGCAQDYNSKRGFIVEPLPEAS